MVRILHISVLVMSLTLIVIAEYESVYYKNLGILVEPTSMVVSYDDKIYHRFYFSLPLKNSSHRYPLCNGPTRDMKERTPIERILKSKIDQLIGIIPTTDHKILQNGCSNIFNFCKNPVYNLTSENHIPRSGRKNRSNKKGRREKRVAQFLAAGAGLALTSISGYYIWKHGEDLDKLKEEIRNYQNSQNRHQLSLFEIKEWSHNLTSKLSNNFAIIEREMERSYCSNPQQVFSSGILSILNNLNIEIDSLMQMINGKVSPHIIDGSVLEKIISSNTDLMDSIYKTEPGLFYQIGSSILFDISYEPLTFGFLLEIPLIRKDQVSPKFDIHNIGWIENDILYQVETPESFYLFKSIDDDSHRAIGLSSKHCSQNLGIYICDNSNSLYDQRVTCINDIVFSYRLESCDIRIERNNKHFHRIINKAKSGILIRNAQSIEVLDSIGKHLHSIKDYSPTNEWTTFVSYKDFDIIIIDKVLIHSPKYFVTHKDYSINVSFPDYISTAKTKLLLQNMPILKLSQLNGIDPLSFETLTAGHSFSGVSMGIDIVLFVIIVLLVYLIYRMRRNYTQLQNEISLRDIKELSKVLKRKR